MEPVSLSLIIPAWNEEKRLPRTLQACVEFLRRQPYTSEIIVVTDGSTDRTAEVARSFNTEFTNLQVLAFADNCGKGFAVKAGMQAARGTYRIFLDADNAVPVETIATFVKKITEGYDIVIGSRALERSEIAHGQGFLRQKLAQLFGFLQWCVLRMPFPDTQCGFKLFTADAANTFFPMLTYDCAYFDAELMYVAYHAGAKIAQLPVVWSHDEETRLPIGLKRSVDLFKKLLNIPQVHASNAVKFQRRVVDATACDAALSSRNR